MERTKDFYLLFLEYALVAIRGVEDEERSLFARQVSDMLHNVPGALRLDWTAERDTRIYAQMRSKAEIYGFSRMLDQWEKAAIEKLGSADG